MSNINHNNNRTAEQRELWAEERQQYVGCLVKNEDQSWLIIKHIDGSLFKAMEGGKLFYVSQRKKEHINNGYVADGGFELWSD